MPSLFSSCLLFKKILISQYCDLIGAPFNISFFAPIRFYQVHLLLKFPPGGPGGGEGGGVEVGGIVGPAIAVPYSCQKHLACLACFFFKATSIL